jgi:hypothetical protein
VKSISWRGAIDRLRRRGNFLLEKFAALDRRRYVARMRQVYSSGISPDPYSARDVLAFVLCPSGVFVSDVDADELDAVDEIIGPVKEEAVRRWQESCRSRDAS